MESLKEFLTPSHFSLFGYTVAVFFLISGVIFTGIVTNLRISERGNFRCDVPDSLENKNTLPLQCFEDYEQQFNSPLPLYGFVLLSFLSSVVVCVIYTRCVKTQVEIIGKDCRHNEEHSQHPRRINSTRVFWSYFLQLLVRLVLEVTFVLLQKVVFFPSDFPTRFLCDSSPKPEANATDFNATTSELNDASRINCHNSVGSEKTSLALALWIVNIVFTVILLGEMIYLAVKAWKRKGFMSDSEFCQVYFFNKNTSPINDQIPANVELETLISDNTAEQPKNTTPLVGDIESKPQIKTFTSSMKKRILASEEIVELEPLIARNPGEQPENRMLDDMYVNLIIHTGRTAHDFESSMKRHEILSSEYVKPEHGSVAINKPEELFLPNEDASDPRKILIIGRPGVGKSLFCNKLMRDWAEDKMFCDVNKSFEMAFFLKFRWFDSEETEKQCLQELLSRAACSDGNIDKEVLQFALENPEKVLLVFDGLDEFKYHERCLAGERSERKNGPTDVMRTSALYVKLVKGKMLPGATVVTTCRPNVVGSLAGLKFDRTVEIMGFTPEKVHEYVTKFCKDDSDAIAMSRTISEHIESNLNLLSLCYIPATCYMICIILQRVLQQGSGNVELPTTLTDVYRRFLTMFIRKHHPEYRDEVLTMDDLSSKARFEETVEETLDELGSLARQGTDERRLIFREDEVQEMEGCGLLNRMPDTETGPFAVEKHFCFIHLTLQEFLAARHIVNMNSDEISRFISSHAADPKWHLVIQFVAGLLRDQQNTQAERHEVVNSIANLLRDSLTSDRDPTMALLMMNCLYELNDDTATKTAATLLQASDTFDNRVDFESCHITAVDCTALVYFLKNMKQLQELNLDDNPSIGDGGYKEIAKLLREGGPEQLNLKYCNITNQGVSDLCEALKHQCCKLTVLNLASNTITDESVSLLCEALKHQHCKLTNLILASNSITDRGASHLCEALKHQHCKLTHLNLCKNTTTDKGVSYLCEALKHQHCKLTHLKLASDTITDKGVSHLCEALKHQHCKLTHLFLVCKTITDKGVSHLCEALKHQYCKLTHLVLFSNNITDKGASDLCEALKHQHCKLTHLDLDSKTITDKDVSHLCEALKHQHCKLTHLTLTGNTITDKGVSHLCEALKHQHCELTHLDLAFNTITDEGVSDLCEALKHQHCKLTHLTLTGNIITDKGVSYLCEAAADENFKLSELTLFWCRLSSESTQKLQNAFANTSCKCVVD